MAELMNISHPAAIDCALREIRAGNVVARAMVRDLFQGPEAQRVMATIQMLFGIAPAIAPMIGGLLLGIH